MNKFLVPGKSQGSQYKCINPVLIFEYKPEGCIHPKMHRCKGCELNKVPEVSDGGCMLLDNRGGNYDN